MSPVERGRWQKILTDLVIYQESFGFYLDRDRHGGLGDSKMRSDPTCFNKIALTTVL